MPGIFRNKLPGMEVVLEFNATPWLPAGVTLTGTPVVTVTVSSGEDPSPNAVLNGAASIDATGMLVLQPVQAGLAGVSYLFDVQCGTTNEDWQLEVQGILPVGY